MNTQANCGFPKRWMADLRKPVFLRRNRAWLPSKLDGCGSLQCSQADRDGLLSEIRGGRHYLSNLIKHSDSIPGR
jgi:hypothetical protein